MSDVSSAARGIPDRLGRYAVRRRIGAGGFATVWLAYDEQLDAPVAIKVLADNWTDDHHVRTRFVEEGRFLRRVESPHVVTVYDAGELDDGRPYLVMTYADQGTLADRLQVGGLSVAQSVEVVRQVAEGLQALHDRGVLHRDIKPANVLFRSIEGTSDTRELRALVGDLGLGKALDMSSRLTMIAGTPSFVAPEQALGETPDARADQYSLGVLAFLLLTGRTPYSHASLAAAAAPGPPPGLSSPDRDYPDAVDHVVHRALSLDREKRWPTVDAFAEALAVALGDSVGAEGHIGPRWLPLDPDLTQPGAAPSQRPATDSLTDPVPPPRRRAPAILLGAAVLVLGAVAGFLLHGRTDPARTVSDENGSLSVTVPDSWEQAVADNGWTPPGSTTSYAALSVGTERDWTDTSSSAQGVFLGVMPTGTEFPAVPEHPECGSAGEPVVSRRQGRESVTVVYSDCPGGVTVERVGQIARNRLLWVQIRSADRATANRVLDSVETHGI
ncbi:MAG: serine/threonine protein kinase [Actinomycetota bacterium]|nr:serine/threonine protein kinase [Actinomycetota bacterium]